MEELNLLCAHDNCTSLSSFAAAFFRAFGISAYTERDGSSYATGHYFQGQLGDIDVTVAGLTDAAVAATEHGPSRDALTRTAAHRFPHR
ncbi:hypothetical protein [Rugamonas violacea]|uniref:hypothetical protein n=1 Tax=Rugamonas sp. CCM 8940 TaxID=2765359 RepID=UPI0018F4AAE4|nr:hypothetical protein [Rugamonas sp. CCM 8940]MBJ7309724.1 hypothetical protein [Rugamonas sp. CCM 8940]